MYGVYRGRYFISDYMYSYWINLHYMFWALAYRVWLLSLDGGLWGLSQVSLSGWPVMWTPLVQWTDLQRLAMDHNVLCQSGWVSIRFTEGRQKVYIESFSIHFQVVGKICHHCTIYNLNIASTIYPVHNRCDVECCMIALADAYRILIATSIT